MRFIVVSDLPDESQGRAAKRAMISVDSIRAIWPYKERGANAAILFCGNPVDIMYVEDKFDDLRARLSDLELPMPGVNK